MYNIRSRFRTVKLKASKSIHGNNVENVISEPEKTYASFIYFLIYEKMQLKLCKSSNNNNLSCFTTIVAGYR